MFFLSLHFNGHFSRWTRVTRYQNVSILDCGGTKVDGGGGEYWSYKTYKAAVKSSPPTNQYPLYRPDALPVAKTNSVAELKGSSHCNIQVKHIELPFGALTGYLGDRNGIRPVKSWVLVCQWWPFDWNFARLTAPVVTTTSIILSFSKTG